MYFIKNTKNKLFIINIIIINISFIKKKYLKLYINQIFIIFYSTIQILNNRTLSSS